MGSESANESIDLTGIFGSVSVRRKRGKRAAQAERQTRMVPQCASEQWSTDFMTSSRVFRALNVVGDGSRQVTPGSQQFVVRQAGRVLDHSAVQRGYPEWIIVQVEPDFTSNVLDE